MIVSLELTPDLAERLMSEAVRRGVAAESVVRVALEDALATTGRAAPEAPYDPNNLNSRRPATREEWLREFEAAEREFEELGDLPEIPMEALRRENMYADEERWP